MNHGTGTTSTITRRQLLRTAAVGGTAAASARGEDRGFVCALAWLNAAEARRLLGAEPTADGELITDEELRKLLARALAEHNDAAGSAARVEWMFVLASPASLDAGEITDKGYVNQRRVLSRRAALAEMLYADPVPAGVIVAEKSSR